jgi:F-type H+-transporting ATPase subunit b
MLATPLAGLLLGAGGLTDVEWGLFLWTFVLFGLFAWVLQRFGWGPLLSLVEERERSIRDAVEGADRANAEAQSLLEKHREMLREAGREREEIIKKALQEAEQVRAELTGKARAEAEQLVQRARSQIEREASQAVLELRAQVADIAIEAASKIVTSSLTPEAQRKLVDEFVKSLPQAAS